MHSRHTAIRNLLQARLKFC